jgi:hypothetical protein
MLAALLAKKKIVLREIMADTKVFANKTTPAISPKIAT